MKTILTALLLLSLASSLPANPASPSRDPFRTLLEKKTVVRPPVAPTQVPIPRSPPPTPPIDLSLEYFLEVNGTPGMAVQWGTYQVLLTEGFDSREDPVIRRDFRVVHVSQNKVVIHDRKLSQFRAFYLDRNPPQNLPLYAGGSQPFQP